MASTSTVQPASKQKPRRQGKNRGWVLLYVSMILLWLMVLAATVRSWVFGTEAVVDSLDISYITLPVLLFNLIFAATTFVIYLVYFGSYRRAIRQQRQAIASVSQQTGPDRISAQTIGDMGLELEKARIRNREPLVSIVIPARNEEGVIVETITSCLNQTYGNIEVVVVCHNCSDKTFEMASSVADRRIVPFRLDTKEAGKGIALNFGVQMSKGDYLLILDGDGRLTDSFIDDAMPLFTLDNDIAAVQGRYVPSNREYNFITRMLALEGDLWSTPFMTFRNVRSRRTPLGGTGYIIRKDALAKVGGFVNHLVDDYELTFRLLRQKYRIAFAPLCINYDEKPPTLDIMLKQRARWLRGFFNLLKQRVAEPSDLIGHLYWINPLTAFTGLAMLLIAAVSTVHYLLFLYYPFHYSYVPLSAWFGLTGSTFLLYTITLVLQYGRKGLKYAAWLPVYLLFSNYYMIVALKALGVKSWADTKTIHGFVTRENVQQKQTTVLQEGHDATGKQ